MKILIIDIETTGFLREGGKIVEVGMVELDLSNGARKIVFNEVTHETGITIEEVERSWIVKNSDLTVDAIRYSKNLNKILPQIQQMINSYPNGATAYNKSFDFDFLRSRGVKIPREQPCPMLVATDVCKLPGRRGYKWPKVEEAYKHLYPNSNYIEKHRGADDAMHEAQIVYKLYKLGKFKPENV
jgi:DNA polymerase-3 subunit epsilon